MRNRIRPADLIRKYYAENPEAWQILLDHSRLVTARALRIGRSLQAHEPVDLQFIAEAAMLHDIGSIDTRAPDLGCRGELPYLCHGLKGKEMLEREGLHRHALLCERHIGVGLTAEEIKARNLPLPPRDMLPTTLEERIICYADLFYSKNLRERGTEKSVAEVRRTLERFGAGKSAIFDRWLQHFEPDLA